MPSFASMLSFLRLRNHHRTTEVYFVGYPKTGNTWIRFMLGRYLQLVCQLPRQPLFDESDCWGRCEQSCIGPRMQFTHRPLTWETQTAADLNYDNVIAPFLRKKVILLVRHPLDAEVSLWCQERYRVGKTVVDLDMFLEDPVFGLEKCLRFHQLWKQNSTDVASFHVVNYESMRDDPHEGFSALLESLAIPIISEQLNAAVEFSSFENMKAIETSGKAPNYRSSGLNIFGPVNRQHPDAFHVRRGKVGGYRDYLDTDLATRLTARVCLEMPWYGSTEWQGGDPSHV